MARFIGAGYIHGTDGALGCSALSGYVSPNIKSLRIVHSADVSRIKNQAGDFKSVIGSGESIECEFSVIAEGSTIANAKKSIGLPPVPSSFTLADVDATHTLPIIAMGSFADALHGGVWIYEGEGSVGATSESSDPWTLTLTLRRYPALTDGAVVS